VILCWCCCSSTRSDHHSTPKMEMRGFKLHVCDPSAQHGKESARGEEDAVKPVAAIFGRSVSAVCRMVVKMKRPEGGAPAEKSLPSYDEAIGHKTLFPGLPKQQPEAAVPDKKRRDPQIPVEKNDEELRKWVMGIVMVQTQITPPQKQALHSRAEQLRNVLIARAKLASVSSGEISTVIHIRVQFSSQITTHKNHQRAKFVPGMIRIRH